MHVKVCGGSGIGANSLLVGQCKSDLLIVGINGFKERNPYQLRMCLYLAMTGYMPCSKTQI